MHRTTIIYGALLVIAAALALGAYLMHSSHAKNLAPYIPRELINAKQKGDVDVALNAYKAITNDPTKSAETKAMAVLNIVGVKHLKTGDISDTINDIRALKKIAVDPDVFGQTRASAIALLALAHNNSGRDPRVFAEIYTGAPWENYLVPNRPDPSALKLSVWAYSVSPISMAAIYAAQLASLQAINSSSTSADRTKYGDMAVEYLQKADDAALQEGRNDPSYTTSDRYLTYRVWRAITIGRLALLQRGTYPSVFDKEYSEFFSFVKALPQNGHSQDENLYARLQYASILRRLSSFGKEKLALDDFAKEIEATDNKNLGFFSYIYNISKFPKSFFWVPIAQMRKLSPAFNKATNPYINLQPSTTIPVQQ